LLELRLVDISTSRFLLRALKHFLHDLLVINANIDLRSALLFVVFNKAHGPSLNAKFAFSPSLLILVFVLAYVFAVQVQLLLYRLE
jgi:hypothetical protein